MNPTEFDILARTRDALLAARVGSKDQIVAEAAGLLGCKAQTVYRRLKAAGFDSGRKRRSDAGESLLTEAQLRLLSGTLMASINNKEQRMPVRTALDILRASGQITADVHESTASRQLHQRRLHPEQLGNATPSLQMRSLHPNHVWQVDSTVGAYYYLPGGRLRWMPEDQFYPGKMHNLVKASSDLLTRYSVADHTSHAFKVKHYLGGETAANLIDFMCFAIWQQDGHPMHGAPLMLIADPGASNKGQVMRNFCKRVGIDLVHHAAGAARVTGSVEKVHDLVRQHFETRLRFTNPAEVTLDRLNEWAWSWAAAYCSTAVHSRHGKNRFAKWMEIRPEQLRVPASLQALRDAAVREPETRRVANGRTISYNGRTFDLTRVPGVVVGLQVTMVENVFRAPAIDIAFTDPDTGEQTWHVVEPVAFDANGYREEAPVWGQDHRTAAYSDADHTRNDLRREAYKVGDGLPSLDEANRMRRNHAQAYAGVVDAMADIQTTQVPTYLHKRGTPLEMVQRQVQAKRISVVAVCKGLKERLGPLYTPQVFADLSMRFGDEGVPEDQIGALEAELRQPLHAQPAQHEGLRAVGGLGGGAA